MTLLENLSYEPVELAFGTSGLRGLATDMTDLECYINTRGFIAFLLETKKIASGDTIALGGDLRPSTPRIARAVAQAILDAGCKVIYLGKLPTPAAAFYGTLHDCPTAVVTGSHIPADRNGIKFYKREGEVLKPDEVKIKESVAKVRQEIYTQPDERSKFDTVGSLKQSVPLSSPEQGAIRDYLARYTSLFPGRPLRGKKVIIYQHSSIAGDLLVELLDQLGAQTIPVDKSKKFIAIDTENVTPENQAYFKKLAMRFPDNFAIISADGDADRPFIIDETGIFQRGDVVGALVATFLKAKSAAVPISASDAVDSYLTNYDIKLEHTKIGSPYVIEAMAEAVQPAVGWEVNGGFLTGSDIKLNKQTLKALPTRDAFLPIVCILISAARQNKKISELFSVLPKRFTQAGLLDNFPAATSQKILAKYMNDTPQNRQVLQKYFSEDNGFDGIVDINSLDGIRITFQNQDIAHIRPSGNAPQLRIYSIANSQERADKIVQLAISDDGILQKLAS